jgi:hypothetical protein
LTPLPRGDGFVAKTRRPVTNFVRNGFGAAGCSARRAGHRSPMPQKDFYIQQVLRAQTFGMRLAFPVTAGGQPPPISMFISGDSQ